MVPICVTIRVQVPQSSSRLRPQRFQGFVPIIGDEPPPRIESTFSFVNRFHRMSPPPFFVAFAFFSAGAVELPYDNLFAVQQISLLQHRAMHISRKDAESDDMPNGKTQDHQVMNKEYNTSRQKKPECKSRLEELREHTNALHQARRTRKEREEQP